jgi:hypothetical protein
VLQGFGLKLQVVGYEVLEELLVLRLLELLVEF